MTEKWIEGIKNIKLHQRHRMLILMGLLNFIVTIFITTTICLTQRRIIMQQNARGYLERFISPPMEYPTRCIMVFGTFFVLLYCIFIKNQKVKIERKYYVFLYIVEITAAIIIMLGMDMAYNGIVFLVVAEIIYDIEEEWNRIIFLVAAVFIYLVCSYNLISILSPMNSFETWVSFYDAGTQKLFLALKTTFEVTNMILFFVYILIILLERRNENKRIKVLNQRLHVVNEQLQNYALERELMGETKERNRLAREIHDTLGHILTGISVGVEAAIVLIDIAPEQAKEQLSNIADMANRGLNDVRRSVRKLKPDTLEKESLDGAIRDMIDTMSKGTNTKIYFVTEEKNLHFQEDEEDAVYRTVQESVTNAIRHGHATEIWIHFTIKEGVFTIIVKDNGTGCDEIIEGFGLKHIRERIELLNGTVQFESLGGFYTIAQIPIRREEL